MATFQALMAPAAVLLLVVVARAVGLHPAWEVHIDELTYAEISRNLAGGEGVSVYGKPFHLHPPAFFVLEAFYLWLFPPPADPVAAVLHVRPLNVAIALVTAAALMAIVRVPAGWLPAVAAGALFAVEPFLVKMNSRNMLDGCAVMFLVLGFAVLCHAHCSANERLRRELGAGLLLGLAILTKDPTAILVFGTLGIWWLLVRRGAIALVVAAGTYASYVIAVIVSGQWEAWFAAKQNGILRAIGALQTTGFKEAETGGHSLTSAVVSNLQELGATCVLLALAAPALIVLVRLRDPVSRLVAAWTASAYALVGYEMAFGTFEEQMFYPAVVPAIAAVTLAACAYVGRAPSPRRRPRAKLVLALLAAIFAAGAASWLHVRTAPDDGYRQLAAYVRASIPPDRRIAVTTEPAKFILPGHDITVAGSLEELRAKRARYVVVSTYEAANEYGELDAARLTEITARAHPVWSFRRHRNDDVLAIYRLPEHF